MNTYARYVSTPCMTWTNEVTYVEAASLEDALEMFEDLLTEFDVSFEERRADAVDPEEDVIELENAEVTEEIRNFSANNFKRINYSEDN